MSFIHALQGCSGVAMEGAAKSIVSVGLSFDASRHLRVMTTVPTSIRPLSSASLRAVLSWSHGVLPALPNNVQRASECPCSLLLQSHGADFGDGCCEVEHDSVCRHF